MTAFLTSEWWIPSEWPNSCTATHRRFVPWLVPSVKFSSSSKWARPFDGKKACASTPPQPSKGYIITCSFGVATMSLTSKAEKRARKREVGKVVIVMWQRKLSQPMRISIRVCSSFVTLRGWRTFATFLSSNLHWQSISMVPLCTVEPV